jgi:hypothetical protein
MKPQDILLLLKIVTLERPGQMPGVAGVREAPPVMADAFSVRALGEATGISKSEVSAALRRCIYAGLARVDHETGRPSANTYGLSEFLVHGIKYVFPVKPGRRVRGVLTAHSAPVWAGKLLSGGQVFVWADAEGEVFGEHIEPLFKSVPAAARRDPVLYALLALIDSVRLGRAREAELAKQWLKEYLRGTE